MKQFRVITGLWLAFGSLGFIYTAWHASVMGGFIYHVGGPGALAVEILSCVFSLAAAVAGYGLLRGWRWARFAIEVLGAVLLASSVIALFFSEVVIGQRLLFFVPAAVFALYSLIVALFKTYEPRPA